MNQTRRQFVSAACALCASAVLAPAALAAEDDKKKKLKLVLKDGKVFIPAHVLNERLQSFKVKKMPKPLLLVKNSDHFEAYSMSCTHMGVKLKVDGDELVCPAHGSIFDLEGNVTKGPAKRNLDKFEIEPAEDGIWVIVPPNE
jgi:Rieske Fe-S protein